ncbi:MAG TPA: plant virulence effector HPE1-like domain-containing protein [Ensifer sp.]|nr:plant virulence effector HPE1-like domain-containing protein [Ensifer sp.]
MRTLLLATLLASAAMPAHSASIEKVTFGQADEDSIVRITCADCPPAPPKPGRYQVPALNGVASMQIVDQNGAPEVIRVDKFMGGSPVTTLSKTQGPLIEEMASIETKAKEARLAARNAELQAIDTKSASIRSPDERGAMALAEIDRESTTASLNQETAAFDPNTLQLRLR